MGKIIVIGSQKGGVGKTTTTLNLAYSLQVLGKKVLTVDFDSQANLTTCYGVEKTNELDHTIGHLMMAQIEDQAPRNLKSYIVSKDGVDFIPSSIYLSVVDAKLRLEMGAERMLAEVLERVRDHYDYILIDTCPSLGILTINALTAADEVIITVNPQLLAMIGLQDFLRTVGKIKKRINPKLEVAGILLTMCEKRTTLCKVLTEEVAESFQGQIHIFETRIPSTIKVGESIYYGMPVEQYSKKASAGIAYRKFAKELIAYEG
jgi:chromosome partitioning protein